MDRAGLTDVLEIGIEIRWISVSVSPIDKPAKPFGARSSVEPRMISRKIPVAIHLCDDHRPQRVPAGGVLAKPVGGHVARSGPALLALGDHIDHQTGHQAADHLRDPVGGQAFHSTCRASAAPRVTAGLKWPPEMVPNA